MLQPAQLGEVAARYRREIAELHSFLIQAGVAVGAPSATAEMAARLRTDRNFHRDLRSHVWVLLEDGSHVHGPERSHERSYADLLGIVAVAAGGERYAATTEESDAHTLLRFLMESRRALAEPAPDATLGNTAAALAASQSASPQTVAAAPDAAAAPSSFTVQHAAQPGSNSGQRSALMAALATANTPGPTPEGVPGISLEPAISPANVTRPAPSSPAVLEADDLRRYPASSVDRARRLVESGTLDAPAALVAHAASSVAPTPRDSRLQTDSTETATPATPAPVPALPSAPTHLVPLHNVDEVVSYDDLLIPVDVVMPHLTPGSPPESIERAESIAARVGTAKAASAPLPVEPAPHTLRASSTQTNVVLHAPNSSATLSDFFFPDHSAADPDSTEEGAAASGERRRRVPAWVIYTVSGVWLVALLLFGYSRLHPPVPAKSQPAPIVDPITTAPVTPAVPPDTGNPAGTVPRRAPLTPVQPRSPHRSALDEPRPLSVRPSAADRQILTNAADSRSVAPIIRMTPPAASQGSAPASTGGLVRTPAPPTPDTRTPATATLTRPAHATQPAVVPAGVLSRQLGSPTVPAYAADPAYTNADGRPHPRLLRRKTALGLAAGSDEVAELHAPNLTPVSRTTSPVRSGTVTPTCLGMMAGNLMYSPAPAYPAAAAAAHVEGAVKIQATVDRDGTITSARVVSGPPLLRDAALDAVQRWRYKPYLASGKPAPAATLAVLDFQLQ